MAISLGIKQLNGCSYELAYDLLGQSTEGNYSNVRLYGILHVTNNYVAWSRGSASVHTSGLQEIGTYYSRGDYTLITRDFTFYHDNNGNFSVFIGASLSTTFTSGDTGGVLTLPSIPRYAKITNCIGDFNDEQTPWFDFSNPANSSMSCWLEVNPNSEHLCIRNLSGSSGRYTWELTETERNQLRAKLVNANNGKGIIRIGLYSTIGGSTQASFVDRNFSIINANPVFSNFEVEDVNPITLALTGDSSVNVNGYSNIKASISVSNKAEAIKQATMKKYQFRIGSGNPIDINYSSDSEVYGIINKANSGTYNVYAIDSRQNTTLVTKLASSEIVYQPILIDKQNSSIARNDNQVGENAILTLNGTIWNDDFGQVVNSIKSVTYRFKKTDDTQWITGTTTITPTVNQNNFTFTGLIASDNLDTSWDLNSSYNVEVTINDELSTSTIEFILNSAIPTLSLDKEGVGIMCAYDSNLGGYLQVAGMRFDAYTTEEIPVGIWIDGKTIYRTILEVSMTPDTVGKYDVSDYNIDEMVYLGGMYYSPTNKFYIPANFTNGQHNHAFYSKGTDEVEIYGQWGCTSGKLILMYTKNSL